MRTVSPQFTRPTDRQTDNMMTIDLRFFMYDAVDLNFMSNTPLAIYNRQQQQSEVPVQTMNRQGSEFNTTSNKKRNNS